MEYPEIDEDVKPRHRFMSAYEQKKEAWDKAYQYLLFSADPYEVIAFKIPNMEVDRSESFFSHWYAMCSFREVPQSTQNSAMDTAAASPSSFLKILSTGRAHGWCLKSSSCYRDADNKIYSLQLPFKAAQRLTAPSGGPMGGPPQAGTSVGKAWMVAWHHAACHMCSQRERSLSEHCQ